MDSTLFKPVGKPHPCPICRGTSGCLIAHVDGTAAAICRHVESGKRVADKGHLHWVIDDGPVWSRGRTRIYSEAAKLATEATA
jgi:hypothetical protein